MDGGVFASAIAASGQCPERLEDGPHRWEPGAPGSPDWCCVERDTRPDTKGALGVGCSPSTHVPAAVDPDMLAGLQASMEAWKHGSMLSDLSGLQAAMITAPEKLLEGGRLVDPHEVHTFLPGLYIRQVTNEKGSIVVTMKHATEHPWFCLSGHLLVRDLETGELHEVHGGERGTTQPGTQRAIYAIEETVFVTVHPNPDDCHDLEELERRFIVRQELPGGKTAGELYRAALAQGEGHAQLAE